VHHCCDLIIESSQWRAA